MWPPPSQNSSVSFDRHQADRARASLSGRLTPCSIALVAWVSGDHRSGRSCQLMSASPRLTTLSGQFLLGSLVVLCALLVLSAHATADTNATMTLADRYSPVIGLEPQPKLCGPGEAYRPTTVEILLGNPEVVVRNSDRRIVKRGPTAQDLSDAPAGDYLDFGGNALRPGCFYEKQFKRWFGDREPTVYAHVATDSEHPGKLAVQYWFYYTFNDFTNKHEGDWE